jgi:lathosterol oxidase
MDTVLHFADQYVFDSLYAKVWPAYSKNIAGAIVSSWPRDDFWRVNLSVFTITCVGGWVLYLIAATASYYLVFDHDYMKHPKFLKNQVRMEIECAMSAIPWMTGNISSNIVI